MDKSENTSASNKNIMHTDYWCFTESIRYECSLTWIINNLSFYFTDNTDCNVNVIVSESFSATNNTSCKWFLELHPSFNGKCFHTYTMLHHETKILLKTKDESEIIEFGPILGEFQCSLIDSEGKKCFTKKNKFTIDVENRVFSLKPLISDNELFNEKNKLLTNNKLEIHCRISYIRKKDTTTSLDRCILKPFDMPKYNPMEDFAKLFNNEDCSDVAIYIGDKTFPAHKSILAARSTVFKAMFTHSMEENRLNRIDIKDIEEEIFEEVLRYVYTGKVKNLETLAFELLVMADKYNIEGLKYMCENKIYGMISVENVLKILSISEKHNSEILKRRALIYIREHTSEVIESQDWNQVSSQPDLMKNIFEINFKRQL